MISVEEALDRILRLCKPLTGEMQPLRNAANRVLAEPAKARLTQPPFDASSMDGYAIRREDLGKYTEFQVIGEAAAGKAFEGRLKPGQTCRIFTGAPVPDGADFVIIQEDTDRIGNVITIGEIDPEARNIRPAGQDFEIGTEIPMGTLLTPTNIALLASMNIPEVRVHRRPRIALLATGDELVMPGEIPKPDQIIASNNLGLAALFENFGCDVRMLPIARDNAASLAFCLDLAKGADLVVTIGGASVGDHDIVQDIAREKGLETAFYKVAMRPGKPLLAGRLGKAILVGLPGNPVSAMVCAHVFLKPAVAILNGQSGAPAPLRSARLAEALPPNGPRAHYMRARVALEAGTPVIQAAKRQDSALLTVLASANALLVRPPHDRARATGDMVGYMPFDH